ncbi:MAG: DUF4333 domain-containing protein [Microbacteriaceae bacterium]
MVPPALAAVAALASCSVSTDKTVSRERLQDQIIGEVTEQAGAAPDSVSCPGDLEATVGATLDCTMTSAGEQHRVIVTVGSTAGDTVDLHIVQTIGKEDIAEQIAAQISQRIGRAPESVSCPTDLEGHEGATLRCELTDGGKTYGVTVTAVSHGTMSFDFKVDDQPRQ